MEEDPKIAAAKFHRRINDRNSVAYRLPPEIIAVVASHLESDNSLIVTTHVCHLWRWALISCPRLWSNLTFRDEGRALAFLKRSKSVPVFVDIRGNSEPSEIVRESLVGITDRLALLRVDRLSFLDELLVKPLTKLESLDVVTSGGFPTANLRPPLFHVPNLTNFRFVVCPSNFQFAPRLGDTLLEFLRSCPLLEVAFFEYGDREKDIEFTTDEASTGTISLPCLRSFTQESPLSTIPIGLFNRLSLPPTCDIAFRVNDHSLGYPPYQPWDYGFPTFRSYLSDVKMVKIWFHARGARTDVFSTTFFNSGRTRISLDRLMPNFHPPLAPVAKGILTFLQNSEVARSVETLHFECDPVLPLVNHIRWHKLDEVLLMFDNLKTLGLWQSDPSLFLEDLFRRPEVYPCIENLLVFLPPSAPPQESKESYISERVPDIAVSRNELGTPLKLVNVYFRGAGTPSHSCARLIEGLRNCVESVKIGIGSSDWMGHSIQSVD